MDDKLRDFPAACMQNWDVRWPMHRNQLLQWGYWFGQPPVDFSDGVLEVQAVQPIPVQILHAPVAEAPAVEVAATEIREPHQAARSEAVQPNLPDDAVAAITPQAVAPPVDPLQLLQQALDEALGAPVAILSRMPGSDQPLLMLDRPRLAQDVATNLWSVFRQHAPAQQLPWLHAVLLHGCGFEIATMSAHAAYEQAAAIAVEGSRRDSGSAADWQALWLRLQLRWLDRQGTAARLLGLVRLKDAHAALSCNSALAVQLAWVDVLHAWAASQQGPAAVARLAEAEALCAQLIAASATTGIGESLLADTLLLRARSEKGGTRDATLRRANALAGHALTDSNFPGTRQLAPLQPSR